MKEKYVLNENGKKEFPNLENKPRSESTWKRTYKVSSEFLTISDKIESVKENVLIYDENYTLSSYGEKYCGVSKTETEWKKEFSIKHYRSLVGSGILKKVR